MGVVILWNLAILTFALNSYTCIIHRQSQSSEAAAPDNRTRTWTAIVLISISWTVPITIGIVATFVSTCPLLCSCIYVYESGKDICQPSTECSVMFKPFPKWYGTVVFIQIELVFIISLIIFGRSLAKIHQSNNISFKESLCRLWNTYKSSLLLFLTFAVTATPIIISRVIYNSDSAWRDSAFTMVYFLISPIILYYQLAGVQSAVRMALIKIFQCKLSSEGA